MPMWVSPCPLQYLLVMKEFSEKVPVGKFVKLDNLDLVLDVSGVEGSFNVDGVYRFDGSKAAWGDDATGKGDIMNDSLMDSLVDELSRGRYSEVAGAC